MHESLAHEPVRSFVVHHEPTFDRDEVRRHVTVVALTPTRLVVGHTDEHPPDDLLPAPYTSTTTEAVGLGSVQSVVVNSTETPGSKEALWVSQAALPPPAPPAPPAPPDALLLLLAPLPPAPWLSSLPQATVVKAVRARMPIKESSRMAAR